MQKTILMNEWMNECMNDSHLPPQDCVAQTENYRKSRLASRVCSRQIMHAEWGRGLKGHGRRRAHILMSSLLKGAKVLNLGRRGRRMLHLGGREHRECFENDAYSGKNLSHERERDRRLIQSAPEFVGSSGSVQQFL